MATPRDPTGKIGKQIGWLNRNCGFTSQIDFSQVIGPLSQLDITSAMSILKDVEENKHSIEAPTAYVLERAAALPPARRTATRVAIGGGVTEVEVHVDPTGKIGKQVNWLNRNAPLAERISFQQVVEPLSMIDVSSAMAILKELEGKASQIRSPTEWICSAAAKAASETGATGHGGFIGALDPTGKISRQIAWLNKNVSMAVPLVFAEVVQPLSQLDIVSAMAVLKDFEQQAGGVADATAWIAEAAERAAAAGGAAPQGVVGLDPTGKISRQVAWLNRNCDLAAPLSFAEVAEPLSRIDINAAMQILKEVEEQAVNVRDPTGFVVQAASRAPRASKGGGKGMKGTMGMMMGGVPPQFGGWGGDFFGGKVGRVNRERGLWEPVAYAEVKAPLERLGAEAAMTILGDLQKNAWNIRSPTNFVLAAARRAASGEAPPKKLRAFV